MVETQENIFKIKNIRELDCVEEMIQECAACAVRDTRLAWKCDRDLSSKVCIDPNCMLIDKLIACYKDSYFGRGLSDVYIKRVRNEFLFLVDHNLLRSCHNQEHYDLILPIIFFRCIMLNEFNTETAKDRDSNLVNYDDEVQSEVPIGCYDPPEENELWNSRKSKWIGNYDSGKVLKVKLYQKGVRKQEFFDMISTAEDLAIKTKFKTNEAIPLPMRIACEGIFPLKEKYETVKYCSEYARVGCFLYDLLKAASDGRPQLDMLLRLYMVPEVHDVLRNTRHIIRGYGYSSSDKNKQRPLKQYCAENSTESTEYEIPVPFSVKYRSFQAHDETTDLLKATRAQKDKFLVFHDHLYKTYLFDDIDILDFYLDKTILEPCIDMDDTIRKYAKAVKILVRKLPVYEDTVTHAETAIRMTKLFREDQVQEAWENSDDYAVRQEVKKIFGI